MAVVMGHMQSRIVGAMCDWRCNIGKHRAHEKGDKASKSDRGFQERFLREKDLDSSLNFKRECWLNEIDWKKHYSYEGLAWEDVPNHKTGGCTGQLKSQLKGWLWPAVMSER